ncbi:MAG: alpha/beta hydrolase family protein [Ancrocorticia sp.]|jgi:hypothetical protein|nr:alpha/beta hydrolase family protein [Ancrocorticia sp.]MCI2193296.1 alpha/beta hydrolase family protein [Ancrocorticia sp.]
MTIDEDVLCSTAAADRCIEECTAFARFLEDAALERHTARVRALDDFSGASAIAFERDGTADQADTAELAAAIRRIATCAREIVSAAHAEQRRREEIRAAAAQSGCRYDPILSPTGQVWNRGAGSWLDTLNVCTSASPITPPTYVVRVGALAPRNAGSFSQVGHTPTSSARIETLQQFEVQAEPLCAQTRARTHSLDQALGEFTKACAWGSLQAVEVIHALQQYLIILEREIAFVKHTRKLFALAGSAHSGVSTLPSVALLASQLMHTPAMAALSSMLLASRPPAVVSSWFAQLPVRRRELLIAQHPHLLRNLDGIPAEIRDRLNRQYLEDRLTALAQAGPASGTRSSEYEDLAALHSTLARADAYARERGEVSTHLLVLDTSGLQVKAALAYGDVAHADHVQVAVPGIGTTIRGDIAADFEEMRNLNRVSVHVLREYGRSESVASVAWLGYDAPQITQLFDSNSVTRVDAARTGASRLRAFTSGIATDNPTANISLIGHSYGSVVTLLSIQEEGHGADQVIAMGSPGFPSLDHDVGVLESIAFSPTGGTLVQAVARLAGPIAPAVSGIQEGAQAVFGLTHGEIAVPVYVDEGAIFHIEAAFDGVDDLEYFGPDLSGLDGVVQLSSGDSERGHGITSHSNYLEDRSTSQFNVAAVSVGLSDVAITRDHSGVGDALLDLNTRSMVLDPQGEQ